MARWSVEQSGDESSNRESIYKFAVNPGEKRSDITTATRHWTCIDPFLRQLGRGSFQTHKEDLPTNMEPFRGSLTTPIKEEPEQQNTNK